MLEYHPAPWDQWVTVGDIRVARSNHAVLSLGPQQLPCSGDVRGHFARTKFGLVSSLSIVVVVSIISVHNIAIGIPPKSKQH